MDKTIRKNAICVIGQPACDFVFSSTRTCFIGYGFKESTLEMNILRALLEKRGVQVSEAGGILAPGQSAFCAKICSKIITSQFCIIILNNDENGAQEIPNANVNMEYGLMLGFNKYVIPFQRQSQKLPFNVAGLDTIKYSTQDFEQRAAAAIDQAIEGTSQDAPTATTPIDEIVGTFLLLRRAVVTPLSNSGDAYVYELGKPLGFNLLNDFGGVDYMFFGNFTALRPETVLWRVRMLDDILEERKSALVARVQAEQITPAQSNAISSALKRIQIWVLVTSQEDKGVISEKLSRFPTSHDFSVFSIFDIQTTVSGLAFEEFSDQSGRGSKG